MILLSNESYIESSRLALVHALINNMLNFGLGIDEISYCCRL